MLEKKQMLTTTRKQLAFLFFIALVWTFLFSTLLQLTPAFSPLGDDGSYLLAAKQLYNQHLFNDSRPIFIAALQGFPYVFGASDATVIGWSLFLNFVCWWFTISLLYLICATRFSSQIAFKTALFFIFCIGNSAVCFNMLSESIFICSLVAAVYTLNLSFHKGKEKHKATTIALLLAAVLIKPVAIGLVVLVVFFSIKSYKKWLFVPSGLLLVLPLFFIGIQLQGLKKQHGDYTLSYIGAYTYYNYLGAKADCLQKGIAFIPGENVRAKKFTPLSPHQKKEIADADFNQQLLHNSVNLSKAYAFCLYSNSSKGSYIVSSCSNKKQTHIFKIAHWFFKACSKLQNIVYTFFGLVLAGFFLMKRQRGTPFQQIVSLQLLYLFFIAGLSCYQCDRFHIVFFPLTLLLAASYWGNKSKTMNQ